MHHLIFGARRNSGAGQAGLERIKKMTKKISEQIRRKVVEAHSTGLSNNKVAAKFGISATSVARILKENSAQKNEEKVPLNAEKTTEERKKILEMERKISKLEDKISYYESKKRGTGV